MIPLACEKFYAGAKGCEVWISKNVVYGPNDQINLRIGGGRYPDIVAVARQEPHQE